VDDLIDRPRSIKEVNTVGIIMVATNDYLSRWFDTAISLEQSAFLGCKDIRIHLFTNRPQEAQIWASFNLKRIKLVVHQIDAWGWPEATLYRYRFIHDSSDALSEEILMYLDSDMQVMQDFANEVFTSDWDGGLALVQHPGYFRNSGVRGIYDYLTNPKMLLKDKLYSLRGNSGLGAWEENKESSSYVEPKNRKTYVHGAVWLGQRKQFIEMCKVLANNVSKDLEFGYIAKWHDESHLNWYSANRPYTLLDVRFSWFKGFKNLRHVQPFICTVEKEKGEGREPTNTQE
jgi:hypothetical protein